MVSAKERMRKYRERLKADPERYAAKKKKHANYVKSKTKKIKDLSDEEKLKIRKKWREAKRKQKAKKRQLEEKIIINEKQECKQEASTASKSKQSIHMRREENYKKRVKKLAKKFIASQQRVRRLITMVNRYKQKLYRTNTIHSNLKIEFDKLKCRNEMLEISLKNAYAKCGTNKEKKIMKTLVDDEKVKASQKKTYMAKVLGLKGKIRRTKTRTALNKRQADIEKFFLRDDISRLTSGKKECRTLNKNKQQIRYMTDTLFNLFKIYREEGGKCSFTTFYKYKPFFVLSPNINNRETCLCIKHNNMELLFHVLKKNLILRNYSTMTDVLKALSCDIKSEDCMSGNCEKCQNKVLKYDLDQGKSDKILEWNQWERVDHVYVKSEKGEKVNKLTKKTKKVSKNGTVATLIKKFEENLPAFKKHYFIWQHQHSQYRQCVKDIKPDEIFIICDFSENYQCKLPEEIQANHFAKNLISLHTGMIYTNNRSQSFCTLSDDTTHEPAAIWAHLLPIIKLAKNLQPLAKVLHVYSDGPSSQYRQKKNFYLLSIFTKQLGFDYSTWSYSEAGHGKGVADGIGGCIKRALDRQVSYGNDITDGVEAHQLLQKCVTSVKCIYIPNTDFKNIDKLVPDNLLTLAGTMKIHQIISQEPNTITYRNLSCFCGQKRGLCKCHSPKIHQFKVQGNDEGKRKQKEMIEENKENEQEKMKENRKRNKTEIKVKDENDDEKDEITKNKKENHVGRNSDNIKLKTTQETEKFRQKRVLTLLPNSDMNGQDNIIIPDDEYNIFCSENCDEITNCDVDVVIQEGIKEENNSKRNEKNIKTNDESKTENNGEKDEKLHIKMDQEKVKNDETNDKKHLNNAQKESDNEKLENNLNETARQKAVLELSPYSEIKDQDNIIIPLNADEYNIFCGENCSKITNCDVDVVMQEGIKEEKNSKRNEKKIKIKDEGKIENNGEKEQELHSNVDQQKVKNDVASDKKQLNNAQKESDNEKLENNLNKKARHKTVLELLPNSDIKDQDNIIIPSNTDKYSIFWDENLDEMKKNNYDVVIAERLKEEKNNEKQYKNIEMKNENQTKENKEKEMEDCIKENVKEFEDELISNSDDDIILVKVTPQDSKNVVNKKRPLIEESSRPRKRIKLEGTKESTERQKGRKSIRSVVTRSMNCKQCKLDYPFQLCIKCIACNMWLCNTCSDNYNFKDFICISCLEG